MTEAWAIIPAGGSGSRFSATQDKLLAQLAGKAVLQRTLEAFLNVPSITGIVLVASEQNIESYRALVQRELPDANIHLTLGGFSRRDSVYQGLLALPDSTKIVAIHDAARPLIQSQHIEACLNVIESNAVGAVVALPIVDTVKQAKIGTQLIESTVDRTVLWRAQTPQTFLKSVILQAHQTISQETPVTDDAQLLELAGLGPVQLISGSEQNLKITGPQDILLAEAFLAR
jgi:2-C-methyl-D-erythritol 4-phosphate cytidylyltransferase